MLQFQILSLYFHFLILHRNSSLLLTFVLVYVQVSALYVKVDR